MLSEQYLTFQYKLAFLISFLHVWMILNQVLTWSRSPLRSLFRCPHRPTWDTSWRRCPPPARTQPARTRRQGKRRRMMMMRGDQQPSATLRLSSWIRKSSRRMPRYPKENKTSQSRTVRAAVHPENTEDERQTVKGSDVVNGVLCTRVQRKSVHWCFMKPLCHCCQLQCIYIIFLSLYKLVWSLSHLVNPYLEYFQLLKMALDYKCSKKCMYVRYTSVSVCIKSIML